MHSSMILALFAAGALAQPLNERRGNVVVQTQTEVKTVFVTAGGPAPAPTANGGWQLVGGSGGSGGWTPVPQATGAAKVGKKKSHAHAHAHVHNAAKGSSAAVGGSTGGSGIDTSGANTYQNIVLTHHNLHRANHSASPLTWSTEMANLAQAEAQVCVFAHNVTGAYGQNIAAGVDSNHVSEAITNMFYNNEEPYFSGLYGQANPTVNFASWGHFSQIVWKGTTSVGCATVHCSGGLASAGGSSPWFTVCNYSPPGNVGNQYGNNIGQPLGHPTITGGAGMGSV